MHSLNAHALFPSPVIELPRQTCGAEYSRAMHECVALTVNTDLSHLLHTHKPRALLNTVTN